MPRVRRSAADQELVDRHGPDFSEALARGLRVLTAFDATRRQMSLSDVAKVVELPRATVRRALYTLARLGYVEEDGRLFRLAPQVLGLASAYLASNGMSAVLQRAVEGIATRLGESCSAAILDGQEIVFVARAGPTRLLGAGIDIGYRLPAYCSSMGRALLAGLDAAELTAFLERTRLAAITPHTITDRRRLREAIRRDGAQGYSLVEEEVEIGFRSVAVPVRRYDGRVACALNAGAPVDRVAAERLRAEFLPVLREVAAELGPLLL
ncbi:MAG: helix-turn-helix domain-containing protein [Methylobacteriaceae bacterium]|nr:helix-turn-helix domain-containing protein [Methylobacteriaceae bacterium]